MQQGIKKIKNSARRRSLKIAVVVAEFNKSITDGLLAGARRAINDSGIGLKNVKIYHVEGSFEVVQLAMRLAQTKHWHAIVCLGAIIKGETTHDYHLASAVTDGLLRVALDRGVCVGLGVITANNLAQAKARSGDNKYNRGYAAAAAVINLASQKI